MIERWMRARWSLLVIGILAALLGWQTLRIEGFRAGHITAFGMDRWLIDLGGFKPALASCTAQNVAFITAQAEADALAAAANEDEERRTAANAERSDASHADDQIRADAAGRDYISRNRIAAGRVRPQSDRGEASQTPAATGSGRAAIPAEMPADPFVAISDPDLQTCTAAVTYAVGAHNWAQTLKRPETAKPPGPQ